MAANNQTLRFEIVVTDNGTGQKQIKQVNQLGDAVERTTRRTRAANKASGDLYDTQNKGVIGTANSTKSFSKLSQTIGHGSSGVVGAYATLAANIFAVTAAFMALRNAAQTSQVMAGLEAAGNRTGRTLTIVSDRLREVTGYAISAGDAMRATAQATAAGFNSAQIERLGRAANNASFALGRNMQDALDRLSRGVIKLEPELLDELGIMTRLDEATSAYASQLGRTSSSLTQAERRVAFFNAAIAEAEVKFGGIAEAAGGTRAFDQLSATFVNLTHSVLSFINTAAIPLAQVFSASPTALLGAMLIFASSIKNQLLPGLSDMSKRARDNALAIRESARETIRANGIQSANTLRAAQAEIRGISRNSDISRPKIYNDVLREGTFQLKEQEKALTSLNRSIAIHESQLAKVTSRSAEATARKVALVNALKSERDQFVQLTTALNANRAAQEANLRNAQAQFRQQTRIGTANNIAGNAIDAASALNFPAAFRDLNRSIGAYSSAFTRANNGVLSGLAAVRVGLFAVGTTAKIVGAGLLAALPYIGLVTIGIGLIKAAWEAMKTAEQKALETARNNYEQVLSRTQERVQNLVRLQNSTTDAALRTRQALILQANAVQEIIDAYREVGRAERAREDAARRASARAERARLRTDRDNNPRFGQLDQALAASGGESGIFGERARQQLREQIYDYSDTIYNALGGNMRLLETEAGRALEGIQDLNPELTRTVLGNGARLRTYEDLTAAIDILSRRNAGLSEATSALEGSFREANDAMGEFYRSAVPSTPYDNAIQRLTQLNRTIAEFQRIASETGASEYGAALRAVAPQLERGFSVQLQRDLAEGRRQDNIRQSLSEQLRLNGALSLYDQDRLRAANNYAETHRNISDRIAEELMNNERIFRVAQQQAIVAQQQQNLLQTRLQMNSHLYGISAQGDAARIRAEREIRNNQIQVLQTQQNITRNAIAHQRILIERENLQARNQINEQLSLFTIRARRAEEERILNLRREQLLEDRPAEAAARGITRQRLNDAWAAHQREVQSLTTAIREFNPMQIIQRSARSIQASRDEISGLENQLESLGTQVAALLEQNLTNAELNAQLAERHNEILSERRNRLAGLLQTAEQTLESDRISARILSGRNNTLADQLETINRTNRAARERQNIEFEGARRTLMVQRERARAEGNRPGADANATRDAMAFYNEQLRLLELENEVRVRSADATARQATLELAIFDRQKEGLEWQKTSLEYYERIVNSRQELNQELLRGVEIEERLSLRRRGMEPNENFDTAARIRTAREEYRMAVDASQVRRAMITLEFELLRGQRDHLLIELQQRRAILEAQGLGNSSFARQLDASIRTLNSVDINTAAQQALAVERVRTENLRRTAELEASRPGNDDIRSRLEMIALADRQRQITATELSSIAASAVKDQFETVGADMMDASLAAALDNNRGLINSNENVIRAIRDWINVIQREAGNRQSESGAGSAASTAALRGTYNSRARTAADVLAGDRRRRLSPAQVAGIVGALQTESTPNLSTTIGDWQTGSHRGVQQLSPDRQAAYARRNNNRSYIASSLEEQVRNVIDESFDNERDAWQRFLSSGAETPEEWAQAFIRHIQRSRAWEQRAVGGRARTFARTIFDSRYSSRSPVENSQEQNSWREGTNSYGRMTPAANNLRIVERQAEAANDNTQAVLSSEDSIRELIQTLNTISVARVPETQIGMPDKVALPISTANIGPNERQTVTVLGFMERLNVLTEGTIANLRELGPQGEVVIGLVEGFRNVGLSINSALQVFTSKDSNVFDKTAAGLQVVSTAIMAVSQIAAASSRAKVEAVDREIAAEQRRDGKSAESVAKIQALEQKKDAIQRKAFNTNKKLMMANAIVSTAAGIAMALGSTLPPASIILASIIGAMGAAQLAIIAGTSYQSQASSSNTNVNAASTFSIGRRGDSVDLAKNNPNAGGEIGYLRGTRGQGTNASNYRVLGSAYGGGLPRGYGHSAFAIGEKGPEILTPDNPISIRPMNDNDIAGGRPMTANINITTLDGRGVEEILRDQRGNIITMLRQAANESGETFMEDVNTNVYTSPRVSKL